CVFISTDKAADPVSAMGASKRVGELMVRAAARGHLGTLVEAVLGAHRDGWLADGHSQRVAESEAVVRQTVDALQEAAASVDPEDGRRLGPVDVAVRFGNVRGSRGNVVEIFR